MTISGNSMDGQETNTPVHPNFGLGRESAGENGIAGASPSSGNSFKELNLKRLGPGFKLDSFFRSLSKIVNTSAEQSNERRPQGPCNPTLWFDETNRWCRPDKNMSPRIMFCLAILRLEDPASNWSWQIRLNLEEKIQTKYTPERALLEVMLSDVNKCLHILTEMNPYFSNPNELWGFLNGEFLKWAFSRELKFDCPVPKVRRPIRRRGYRDKGTVSVDRPDKYINDNKAAREREELVAKYYEFLFYILETVP